MLCLISYEVDEEQTGDAVAVESKINQLLADELEAVEVFQTQWAASVERLKTAKDVKRWLLGRLETIIEHSEDFHAVRLLIVCAEDFTSHNIENAAELGLIQ